MHYEPTSPYVKFEDTAARQEQPSVQDEGGAGIDENNLYDNDLSEEEGVDNQKIAVNACLRWKLYRKAPKKLISKISLCCLALLQVYLLAERHNYMVMHTTEAMSFVFLSRTVADSDKLEYQMNDIYDVHFVFHRVMSAYQNAEKMLSGVFQKVPCDGRKTCGITATFRYFTDSDYLGELTTVKCNYSAFFNTEIRDYTIGRDSRRVTKFNATRSFSRKDRRGAFIADPFCDNNLEQAILNSRTIDIVVPLKITPPFRYVSLLQCFEWYSTLHVDMNYGKGSFKVRLDIDFKECDGDLPAQAMLDPAFPISILCMLLVIWDGILWVRLYRKENKFRGWAIFIVGSDVALFIGSCFFIYYYLPLPDTTETTFARWLVYGAAGSLQFFSLLVFLRSTPRLYKLAKAMKASAVTLSYFLFEVTPIFLGFVFSSVMFMGWYSPNFSTFDEAAVSLFSMFLGDNIDAVNSQAKVAGNGFERLFSRAFVFTFTMIFIFAIVNTVRIIITEAYQSQEEKSHQKNKNGTMFSEDAWEIVGHEVQAAKGSTNDLQEKLIDKEDDTVLRAAKKKARTRYLRKLCMTAHFWVKLAITGYVCAVVLVYKINYLDYIRETTEMYRSVFIEPNTYSNDGLSDMRYFNYYRVKTQQERSTRAYFDLNLSHPRCFVETDTPTLLVQYGSFNFGDLTLPAFTRYNQEVQTQTCFVTNTNTTLRYLELACSRPGGCSKCPPITDLPGRVLVVKNQFFLSTRPGTMVIDCMSWNIEIKYDLTLRDGLITVKLIARSGNCGGPEKTAPIIMFWSLLVLLHIVSLVLTVLYRLPWVQEKCISPSERWKKIMMVTDVFGTLVGIMEMVLVNAEYSPSGVIFDLRYISMGVYALLAWINMVGFTETYPSSGTLKNLFEEGVPRCLEFLVSATPIFLGFVMFAMVAFGGVSYNFIDFTSTVSSLFAVLNGDNVWGLINSANMPRVWIVSRIYMIIFCCLFLLFIMNVFFLLFERGFYKMKQHEEELIAKQKDELGEFEMFEKDDADEDNRL